MLTLNTTAPVSSRQLCAAARKDSVQIVPCQTMCACGSHRITVNVVVAYGSKGVGLAQRTICPSCSK